MDNIFSPYQNAFIKGRNIFDNILIAHEKLDILRKKKGRKNSFGALKIDMNKAYDRVIWKFLKAVLIAMNFDQKWIRWIMECMTSVQYTLLINGSISKAFKPSMGLRQGDLLSPYLFLICANILFISLQKAKNSKLINGVKVGRNGCTFTHLLFADDSLLFFKKDNKSLANLKGILDWYYSLFGQNINLAKFDLFCSPNMPKDEQENLARHLQVHLVQNPNKYLGLNFKQRGNRIIEFQYLFEKLHSKLQGWKTKLLSQAGRTLISSVLQTLPLYTFSCYKVPETVCNKMDSIVRAFWWGHEPRERKLHLLNWDKICYPKVAFVSTIKEIGKIFYTIESVCVHMKIR